MWLKNMKNSKFTCKIILYDKRIVEKWGSNSDIISPSYHHQTMDEFPFPPLCWAVRHQKLKPEPFPMSQQLMAATKLQNLALLIHLLFTWIDDITSSSSLNLSNELKADGCYKIAKSCSIDPSAVHMNWWYRKRTHKFEGV